MSSDKITSEMSDAVMKDMDSTLGTLDNSIDLEEDIYYHEDEGDPLRRYLDLVQEQRGLVAARTQPYIRRKRTQPTTPVALPDLNPELQVTVACIDTKVGRAVSKKGAVEISVKPKLRWLSAATEVLLRNNVAGSKKNTCIVCNCSSSVRRISHHVKQHFRRSFCHCGYQHASRDCVGKHQRSLVDIGEAIHTQKKGLIYDVDSDSYAAFCTANGWVDPPEFGEGIPTNLTE